MSSISQSFREWLGKRDRTVALRTISVLMKLIHPDGECSNASDLGSIPAELPDKLRVEFYSDPSQAVGVFEDIFIGRDFRRAFFLFQGNEPFCITGENDTLKEGAIDLSQEFTGGPALVGCLFKIEIAFYVVLNSQPGQAGTI